MKKIKLINTYKIIRSKKIYLFLISLFFIGLISGSFFLTILSKIDKDLLLNQLNSFIKDINDSKVNYLFSLKNSLITNFSLATFVFILGISVIGLLIVPFIIYFKGFTLGFSIGSIIFRYKLKGLISAFLYIFPHMVINSLVFLFLAFHSVNLSLKLLMNIIKKNNSNLDFKSLMKRYYKIYLISIIILIISSFLEVYLNIPIIKLCSYFFK